MHIHGILLAAGQSRRFAGIKQLAKLTGNTSLLEHGVEQFQQSKLNSFSVALGANFAEIAAKLPKVNIARVDNWSQGMGQSLSFMVKQTPSHSTHIMVGLADQVAITSKHIDTLLQAAYRQPNVIVAAGYNQRRGVPAIFPTKYSTQLQALIGDKGAREILNAQQDGIAVVDLPEAAIDIDTQEDLDKWLR